jgi:hypothetical protein
MNPLEIRTLPRELKPAPYNPRARSKGDPAWKKLEASLRGLGWSSRWSGTRRPGTSLADICGCRFSRRWRDRGIGVGGAVERVARRALNVVLNNRDAQGRFDTGRLVDLLTELEGLPEMALTGFDADDLAALRLEPVSETAAEVLGSVEVTLVTDADTYARLAPRLDDLVREFDLVTHLRSV